MLWLRSQIKREAVTSTRSGPIMLKLKPFFSNALTTALLPLVLTPQFQTKMGDPTLDNVESGFPVPQTSNRSLG